MIIDDHYPIDINTGVSEYMPPFAMKAGEKMSIAFEMNRRPGNFADWSVVAQGDMGGQDNLILTPVDPKMKSD